MSESNDFNLSPERQQLLRGKLGRFLYWTRPNIERTIGPYLPDAFDAFDTMRLALVGNCRDRLASYTDVQVQELSQLPPDHANDALGWRRFQLEEVRLLETREPDWFAGGFGHPDHVVDFEYWTKMNHFKVSELTCLSVGIAPKEFDFNALHNLASSRDRPNFGQVLEFLLQRFEQLQRTFGRDRGNAAVDPKIFLAWAIRFEFAVHSEFLEPLQKFHRLAPVVGTVPARKQDQREVDKIAQLFTAMAIDHLGYVPSQARSPTPKEIGEIAAELGMSVTDETIRKYLRIGARFIAPDWKPKQR